MDCSKQLKDFLKTKGYRPVFYIGFCADEKKRFKKDENIYPLAELGIYEATILEWAKNQEIFNDYYKYNARQGCMFCPMSSMDSLAYLCLYYPKEFETMFKMCKDTEAKYNVTIFQSNPKYNSEYIERRVKEHYVPILKEKIERR